MTVVDIYVDKPVPVQDMEFTFVYDPAMVEAALHPTVGRSSRSVLKRYCDGGYPTMSGLVDPEIVLVSKGKISHFVTLCITNFKEFSR